MSIKGTGNFLIFKSFNLAIKYYTPINIYKFGDCLAMECINI